MKQVKILFEDLTYGSKYTFLEEGKDDEELQRIGQKAGLELPSPDIAVFKGKYAMVDKENKNRCTLPREEVEKALHTLKGKAIDIDHMRRSTVGFWLDSDLVEDDIISYGAFWKSNYSEEYEDIKRRMESGEGMAISMEAWGTRVENETGYDLTDIHFAGGALLDRKSPAEPTAGVLEFAKVIKTGDIDSSADRGDVVFPKENTKVKDNKDYFPINNIRQARNALARVVQYSASPSWYDGTLSEVQEKVKRAVKKKYPSIEVSNLEDAQFYLNDTEMIIRLVYNTKDPDTGEIGLWNINMIDYDKEVVVATNEINGNKVKIFLTPIAEVVKQGRVVSKVEKIQAEEEPLDKGQEKEKDGGEKMNLEERIKELEEALAQKDAEIMKKDEEISSFKAQLEEANVKLEQITKEQEEAKVKLEVYEKAEAERAEAEKQELIKSRREELGDIVAEYSDEDILDETKYIIAQKDKEIAELKAKKPEEEEAKKEDEDEDLEAGSKKKDEEDEDIKFQKKVQSRAFRS